jgi:hypothetical protein
MQRIRIKTAPKLGDQVDYSFYDSRNRNAGMAGNVESDVKNTMGPVPREEATIEVEKGEVVVGDTNQDGFLELFTFTGKPHSKGGTPVDVPPGSFIYSNTRKLRIKDGEVLTKLFGLTDKKDGYTPAEIAKRYQINEHVATLKDDRADNIQKRSASEMLKNNIQKLGVLALVQESMKGFPDGIPAIAESAAIGLGMDPAMFDPAKQQEMMAQQMPEQGMQPMPEQMPMARYGGMPKYQFAGRIKGDQMSFTPGTRVFINNKPYVWKETRDNAGLGTGDTYVFKSPTDGDDFYIDSNEFNRVFNTSNTYSRLYGDRNLNYYIADAPGTFNDGAGNYGGDWYSYNYGLDLGNDKSGQRLAFKKDNVFFAGNKMYKVTDPYRATTQNSAPIFGQPIYASTGSSSYQTRAAEVMEVEPVYDATGNVISYRETGVTKLMPDTDLKRFADNRQLSFVNFNQQQAPVTTQTSAAGSLQGLPPGVTPLNNPTQTQSQPAQPAQQQRQPAQRTQSQPARPAGKPKTASDALNDLKFGGYVLPRYQTGSTVTPDPNANTNLTSQTTAAQVASQTNQAPDPKGERFLKQVETEADGIIYIYINPATGQVIGRDDKGTIKTQRAMTDAEMKKYTGQNSQYGSKQVQEILAKNPDTRYTYTNFGTFGSQPRLGNTGIYLSSGNAASHKDGDLSAAEWQDFYDRHGDWIDQSYTGGFEQFKKDLKTSPEKGNTAAEWFQKQVNKFTQEEFGIDYFAPKKTSENPYSVDSMFGQVTYSVPRFFKIPKTPPPPTIPPPVKPGMKQAFYCVEAEDGSRSVQTVEYPENGSPTAPTGKNVKQYSSRADADAGCVETPEDFKKDPIKKSGPWWAQDIVTFTDTMTRGVNKYEPMMQQVDLLTSEYTPLKKDAQVANIQQMQNQFMNLAQNSNDGNVATAAALGASGESFQNAANVMSQIENQNSNLATNNSLQNVGIENQERMLNAGYRGQYVGQMATANQQFDNAQNRLADNRRQALVAGMSNNQRKILQEEVVTPQVFIDPITFKPHFTGRGRQWDLPDLYQNPYMGGSAGRSGRGANPAMTAAAATSDADLELYDKYYQELLPKYGKEQAEKLAMAKMGQYNSMMRGNPAAVQYTDPTASLMYPGGFNPNSVQEMGGAITIEDLFYMMNKANKR